MLSLWNGILGVWINIGTHIFPPVIHPMMVHFPIALLWGSLLVSILAFFWRTPDRYLDRSSFWLLVLGLIAGVWVSATGVISEQFVQWTPTTSALLSTHQAYAILTGLFGLLALASRLVARYPHAQLSEREWSLNGRGRGRQTALSFIFLVGAVVMVTWTASIGGTMVYQYGVGVHGVSYKVPADLK